MPIPAMQQLGLGFVAAMLSISTEVCTANAAGYTLKTLYTFCVKSGCPDGEVPQAVVKDPNGPLYGTTYVGGRNGAGVLFSLTPKAGGYKYQTLYSFCKKNDCADGGNPAGQLVEDVHGNLYGTTTTGVGGGSAGTIFRLSPGSRRWNYKVLYTFCTQPNCSDGIGENTGLSYDGQAAGTLWDGKSPLFGTTTSGAKYNNGDIFELVPSGSQWNYTVIHNIQTGHGPNAVLVGKGGDLFVTSTEGGANDGGNFYMLASGTWKETTIHNFCSLGSCADGLEPAGTLALDGHGNVYGVTLRGGTADNGVLFERPASGGFSVLYNFCGDGSCGRIPENLTYGNVSQNLFGTANEGGGSDHGVVFQLTFKNGIWTEKIIADFCPGGNCASGAYPYAPILEDSQGNLFSVASQGGNIACDPLEAGCGTVFELKK